MGAEFDGFAGGDVNCGTEHTGEEGISGEGVRESSEKGADFT
jgi:hypothetical protein